MEKTHRVDADIRFASPEANAARRVVLGYLSRRRTSLINRQTFGEAVGEDGRSDARRWKKSRGARRSSSGG